MPHRAHLFSLKVAHAIRDVFSDGYSRSIFAKDVMAGCVVGVIAIPLAMALAIASGVAPQYGLYSAIIAGFLAALTGGSRYSITGPTAAFVVVLHPLVSQHGISGLLLATIMAGLILTAMAFARLGRFIEYIPSSVTLGFTGGIGIVIATLQIPDFLGLPIKELPENYYEKILSIVSHVKLIESGSLIIAGSTLTFMLIWPRLKTSIPAHLPALILASILAFIFNQYGINIETIGSRFHYLLSDGTVASGIPSVLPHFEWPWLRGVAANEIIHLSWSSLGALLPAAFAIAMLGAIESLLCAVVLDGMSGKQHSANSELLGQGIANIVAPFFGGITATAAIARSAASVKAGARSPVAGMVHSIIVLLALVALAPLLAFLPMPALAAMLLVIAWNMSEASKSITLIKTAPVGDIVVLVTCLSLTVWFDMVIAIFTGIVLASILFMREIASMTKIVDITENKKFVSELPPNWKVLKINGPLFFAAADRVFGEINEEFKSLDGVILYLEAVPILDSGGLAAMSKLIKTQCELHKKVYFCDWQFQPLRTLAKAKVLPVKEVVQFFPSLEEALKFTLMNEQKINEIV